MTLRITFASVCCLALLLSACTGDPNPAASTPATSATPTMTASPTPTRTPDPKTTAATAAIAAYRRWRAGIFKMEQSGGNDVSMLEASATGTQLNLDRSHARQVRMRKIRATRDGKILSATVARFGSPDAHGRITAVDLTTCIDVTPALAVDSTGKSVVVKNRPPRLIEAAKMQAAGATWKSSLVTNRQAKTC